MNMSLFLLFFLNLLLIHNYCECAKILAVMPTPSFSHQVVFQPLWKKLLRKGHEITLLTTDPIENSNFVNLKQIDWSFAYNLWHHKHNLSKIILSFRDNKLKCFNQYTTMMHDIVSQELEYEDVQKLINDKDAYFDLAVIEFLHPTMLAFSEKFKCPFIGVSSMDMTTFGHEAVGHPTNPAIYTDFLVPYDSTMSYLERLLNTLNYIGVSLYFNYYMYPLEDDSVRKYFGENILNLKDIQKKVSMVFLNTNPILHDTRPLMPNVLQIGGAIHLHNLISLPADLELFLNSSKNGAVYFSLGSNVKVMDLPPQTFDILLDTFTQLPFRVVWKTDVQLINASTNIYTGNWLPQQEILAHKNIKAFITQGGQQSLEEAIYYGVPIIGLPFYVDQFANVRRLSRKGACIGLDVHTMKKQEFLDAIQQITTNESYITAVKELSVLLKDVPTSGLEKAVWWTEYVIRHKGANILKSNVPHIPYYQYYLIDVISTFLFVTIIIVFIVLCIVKLIMKSIQLKGQRNKVCKLE